MKVRRGNHDTVRVSDCFNLGGVSDCKNSGKSELNFTKHTARTQWLNVKGFYRAVLDLQCNNSTPPTSAFSAVLKSKRRSPPILPFLRRGSTCGGSQNVSQTRGATFDSDPQYMTSWGDFHVRHGNHAKIRGATCFLNSIATRCQSHCRSCGSSRGGCQYREEGTQRKWQYLP